MSFAAIQEILRACGYPYKHVVTLDAECYFDSDYTLSKMSTYEYLADPRFEIHGWAVKHNDDKPNFVLELPKPVWKNTTVVLFNAPFDALILARYHKIHPPFVVDVLDLARHIEPRWPNKLAALCKRHGLTDKGDTKQFKGLHRVGSTGQQWVDLVNYACNDVEQTFQLLLRLLPKLSNPAFELKVAKYTRNLFIYPTLDFNEKRAIQLEQKMLEEVGRTVAGIDATEKEIRGNLSFERLLREALGDEEPPMKQGKLGPILAIAKTDEGYKHLLNHTNVRARRLMEARVATKSWPIHIKRVQKMRAMYRAAGNLFPVPLLFCGAHTGRWSGGGGVNLQNLAARSHPLVNSIRNLIRAPAGYTLIIEDFAQIEARVLAWIAGQDDLVQQFASGTQIYCDFASEFIGHFIRKPKKTDSKTVAKWHGTYRQMGKIGILGAGYGLGWEKCMTYAKNTYGVVLSEAQARRLIKLYRKRNQMIVLFWGDVERAFRLALQTGQTYELPRGLRFFRDGNTVVIQLPSTRCLRYADVGVDGTTRRPSLWMPDPRAPQKVIHMWGGYLTENIVQASSRDILAEAVLKIEEQLGVRIPLMVHDDMSTLALVAEAEELRDKIEAIARVSPTWAPGLPVDIEGKISKEYIKI